MMKLIKRMLVKRKWYTSPQLKDVTYDPETCETIDGKWWQYRDGKPVRPLTDAEVVDLVWGTKQVKHE